MKNRPIIGITTYGKGENNRFSIPDLYVDSVRRAEGIPVLIPVGETEIDSLLNRIDGLLLPGGGDIAVEAYGGAHHESVYGVDKNRDQTEFKIARASLRGKIPTLAICRGLQIINIVLGGTLVENVPDEFGEEVPHRLPLKEYAMHSVAIDENSKLYSVIGEKSVEVASRHHQSIRKPGEGLKVVSRSKDGLIEAVELDSHPWMIGLQWHPEYLSAHDPPQQRIFDLFVRQCALNLTSINPN